MEARIWGCRGSLATPGARTLRYGGNTTCLEVRSDPGRVVVIDAGTGVRSLGLQLAAEGIQELDVLLTHLHLDHIEGLGFLAPLFVPGCRVTIHGPRPAAGPLADTLAAYLSPPFFPVPFERFDAQIRFVELERETFELDGLRVTAGPVRHSGPTLAYRLEEGGRSLAFVPDHEPALERDSGLAIAGGADVLLHDAQYSDEEYALRVGWGHTAPTDLVRYLADAAPARTVMVHHDPDHDEEQLRQLHAQVAESGHPVELGYEGMAITP